MLKRQIVPLPKHVYPRDDWRIVEARWPDERYPRSETIFSLANGYLGTRGTFDEGLRGDTPGTLLNGFTKPGR